MPSVLVCGSTAIDLIGHYQGSFAKYQAQYQVEALNFSLQLADLRSSFGGCGINIAYGLKKLGVDCIPLSAAGKNFRDHYEDHLLALGINIDHIVVDESFPQCATAVVISDDHGNQITAFYAGASVSDKRKLPSEIPEISACTFAVLAPEQAPIMLRQARDLNRLNIPIFFDPGQCLTEFNKQETRELLSLAQYTMVNDYEFEILQNISDFSQEKIESMMRQIIVTRGAEGVDIYEGGKRLHVDAAPAEKILDPTGCGDAFRAGYIYGVTAKHDAIRCGRLGNLMAVQNLRSPETQKYDIDETRLNSAYETMYPESGIH